jgi:hypothetical protein
LRVKCNSSNRFDCVASILAASRLLRHRTLDSANAATGATTAARVTTYRNKNWLRMALPLNALMVTRAAAHGDGREERRHAVPRQIYRQAAIRRCGQNVRMNPIVPDA